jgi:hypothetical protein
MLQPIGCGGSAAPLLMLWSREMIRRFTCLVELDDQEG